MKTKILIFLTLISLSVGESSLKTRFKKCCPPDEIFSGLTKVGCVPVPQFAMELYRINHGDQNVSSNASESKFQFPICENPEDIATTPVAELKSTDFLQRSSCLEVLHEPNLHQSVPIIVHCQSDKYRDEENKEPILSLPRLLDVRRCCPRNTVFDESNGSCVSIFNVISDENFSDTNEFLSMLPKELDSVDFLNVSRISRKCQGATFTYVINPEDLVYVNGILQVTVTSSARNTERLSINSENACLELTPDFRKTRRMVVRVCRSSDLCQDNVCVRKCCNTKSCLNDVLPDSPSFFHEAVSKLLKTDSVAGYGLMVGPKCKYGMFMLTENDTWSITPEGYISFNPDFKPWYHDEYCMEMFYNNTTMNSLTMFACFDTPIKEPNRVRFIISNILEAISCVFLLLTLLVYACLPTLQNLHGKTLMCHSASLLVAFACLSIIPWVTPPTEQYGTIEELYATKYCAILAFIMLFAFWSAFCWLNVMCFDIWRTFGRLRGTISRGQSHNKQFLFYCLYAWGLSMFITVFGVLSDEIQLLPRHLSPNFGSIACWFESQPGMYGDLIFFRGPIAIQLTSNVVFFILTSERCSKVKAEIRRVADPSDPRSKRFHADKTKFIMNVKLFIVMGISWIAEIISSFVNQYTNYTWQEQVFYATDALNCLQGVLIFLLFVMKKRVYHALMKRLGFEKRKGLSQGTSTLQDPLRVKMSASNSTLTSSFGVSLAP
ncbi:putative G-protein coupled receptor Mth-like 2 [Osmia lignaria lignaria]|uniref:putative G-protein coupled receptor Mth-like 2 n=1 Tax=Osmia lignaria lignaria TaxID=1437193 RepID=UPI00402B38D6